ncbi:MAG: hypothetical protein AB7I27_17145 [Bacteriovoracaceae bacterium]
MVFYTLSGPAYTLEVYQDKITLKRKWWKVFSKAPKVLEWKLDHLAEFNISHKSSRLWEELKWKSFDGIEGRFYCSTNRLMLEKIEKYMNKRIMQNKHDENHLLVKGQSPLQETIISA